MSVFKEQLFIQSLEQKIDQLKSLQTITAQESSEMAQWQTTLFTEGQIAGITLALNAFRALRSEQRKASLDVAGI